jgi:hypothetical protein
MFDPYYLKEISYKNLYFTIFNNFNLIGDILFSMATKMARWDPDGSVNNWPSGSGYIIKDNGSADLAPKDRSTTQLLVHR